MKPKEYHINSFEKLCNIISKDNFDGITTDLILWLGYHVEVMQKIREDNRKETKNKSNWELANSTFIWIDDGKHDMKDVIIENGETGEISKITFNYK